MVRGSAQFLQSVNITVCVLYKSRQHDGEETAQQELFLVRDVDEACQVTSFMEAKANNTIQVTELDGAIVEQNGEVKIVTDRRNLHDQSE